MERQRNPKRTVIIFVVALILLMGLMAWLTRPHKTATIKTGESQVYNDPVSHQKIVTRNGAAPETNGQTSTGPVFVGFEKLLDYGVTVQQLDALKTYFSDYTPFINKSPEISLAVDDIQAGQDMSDPQQRFFIHSHVVVDRKTTYEIKFYYQGLSSVELHIYDASGNTQLFDSSKDVDNREKDGN